MSHTCLHLLLFVFLFLPRPVTASPTSAPPQSDQLAFEAIKEVGVVFGEQYDPDLGLYYLRARFFNPQTGRFWSADSYEGGNQNPITLHKYLYGNADPIQNVDPAGTMSVVSVGATMALTSGIANSMITASAGLAIGNHIATKGAMPDGIFFTLGGGGSIRGATGGASAMILMDIQTRSVSLLASAEVGLAPVSYFNNFNRRGGWIATAGLTFNSNGPKDFAGLGFTATWPASMRKRVLPKNMYGYYHLLTSLAAHNGTGTIHSRRAGVINFGVSTSGASYVSYGFHFNNLATTVGWTLEPIQLGQIPPEMAQLVNQMNTAITSIAQTAASQIF
jgi:RHS repeat-associated protein